MNNSIQREVMDYDVVIVGAGPAGLSTAIKPVSYTHLTLPTNREV